MNLASAIAILVYTAGGALAGFTFGAYFTWPDILLPALLAPIGAYAAFRYARYLDRITK